MVLRNSYYEFIPSEQRKAHKGNGPSTTAHIDNYMTVYDVESKGYRTINLDTVKHFKCGQFEHRG